MDDITTFIIPSIDRPTLKRAIDSCIMQAPYLLEIDHQRIGEAAIRNGLIKYALTEWVSFLDDDDTVTSDYVARLREEIQKHPDAEVIIFREYFIGELMNSEMEDHFIPVEPEIRWGNVGISYSIRKDVALKHPFMEQNHEDLHHLKDLENAGVKIVFSKYITYRVRH